MAIYRCYARRMTWGNTRAAKAVDFAAAVVFAAAVAFAASALATGQVAAMLALPAFILAYAGLARVENEPVYRLASFALLTIDPPQQPADEMDDDTVVRLFDPRQLAIARSARASTDAVHNDAGQALSEAFAELKRALR